VRLEGEKRKAKPVSKKEEVRPTTANQRIEPMRGSAVSLGPHSDARGALPLMAHPHRYA
jgi:hypothetical protein